MNFLHTLDFTQALILVLIALLFFRDELKNFLYQKFGIKRKDLISKMDTLSGYYNHDTSGRLTKLQETIDKEAETLGEIRHILEEVKEYGVKIRQ